MLAVLRFVSISEWKMQSLKTDYENLVHVYLEAPLNPQPLPDGPPPLSTPPEEKVARQSRI